MNYAQLDFTQNKIKRVNLIGGEEVGIISSLIEQYPQDFINLEGREDIPTDTFNWYYDLESDRFLTVDELSSTESDPIEPEPMEPVQPTNAEIAQAISDLEASLLIAGVI